MWLIEGERVWVGRETRFSSEITGCGKIELIKGRVERNMGKIKLGVEREH